MIVITTADKDKRDRLFEELRKSSDPGERQVVKFSGVEEVPGEVRTFVAHCRVMEIQVYRSTWSVAYPDSTKMAKG